MTKHVVVVEKLNRIGKVINSYTIGPYDKPLADKVALSQLRPDRNVWVEFLHAPSTIVDILKDQDAF